VGTMGTMGTKGGSQRKQPAPCPAPQQDATGPWQSPSLSPIGPMSSESFSVLRFQQPRRCGAAVTGGVTGATGEGSRKAPAGNTQDSEENVQALKPPAWIAECFGVLTQVRWDLPLSEPAITCAAGKT